MMKACFVALTVLLVLSVQSKASAQLSSSDAFELFDGVQGSGGFSYGTYSGGDFYQFASSGPCYIANAVCLQLTESSPQLSVTKAVRQSVLNDFSIPDYQLLFLAGGSGASAYVSFTSPFIATVDSSATFELRNTNWSSADISFFYKPAGGPVVLTTLATLNSDINGLGVSMLLVVRPGDAFGYIIGNAGISQLPAVGVDFLVTTADLAVPEPDSWALMISGLTLVGYRLRRLYRRPPCIRGSASVPANDFIRVFEDTLDGGNIVSSSI